MTSPLSAFSTKWHPASVVLITNFPYDRTLSQASASTSIPYLVQSATFVPIQETKRRVEGDSPLGAFVFRFVAVKLIDFGTNSRFWAEGLGLGKLMTSIMLLHLPYAPAK